MSPERLALRTGTADLAAREVLRHDGQRAHLTPTEVELLRFLSAHEGEVVPRDRLLVEVWGYSSRAISRAVDTTVRRLREKIELDPRNPEHLLTAFGVGYRFVLGGAPRSALPTGDTDLFVGRTDEVGRLGALLPGGGVVTLVGPPGVGKTRLALAVAQQREPAFAGGAVFTDLSSVRGPQQVAAAVAGALGIPAGGDDLDRRLGTALHARGPMLLVLDNCEVAVASVRGTVDRWLRAAPELAVLATSRESLGAERERVFTVTPLSRQDAVELFAALAERENPRFSLERWAEVVAELVERLDRLPLAVALAASRSSTLTPRHLLDRLTDRFRLLASQARDADPRHRTLEAALAVSWELLSVEEREALCALSVCEGGFDTAGAAAVVGVPDPEPLLRLLVDRSLLTRGERWGSFAFVRDYAAAALVGEPRAQAERRHFAWYGRAWERGGDLVPDAANLEVAMVRAVSAGDAASAGGAAVGLARVLHQRGPHVLREHADAILAMPDLPATLESALCAGLAEAWRMYGGGDALASAERAVAAALRTGDADRLAEAAGTRAVCALELGQVEAARESADQALAAARAPAQRSRALGAAAQVERILGNGERARELLRDQLALAQEHGLPGPEFMVRLNLGRMACSAGRFAEARDQLEAGLSLARRHGLLDAVMSAECWLAGALVGLGETQAARVALAEADRIAARLGNDLARSAHASVAGGAARAEGEWLEALGHHQRALAILEDQRTVWRAVEVGFVGEMLVRVGRGAEARAPLEESVAATAGKYPDAHAHFSSVLAELELGEGRRDEAARALAAIPDSAVLRSLVQLRRRAVGLLVEAEGGADRGGLAERMDHLAEQHPPDAELRHLLAQWRERLGGRPRGTSSAGGEG